MLHPIGDTTQCEQQDTRDRRPLGGLLLSIPRATFPFHPVYMLRPEESLAYPASILYVRSGRKSLPMHNGNPPAVPRTCETW